MTTEHAAPQWAPIITCQNCENEVTEARFAMPQISGRVVFLCWGHAQDWYDEDSKHLLPAARKLAEVHPKDQDHMTARDPKA